MGSMSPVDKFFGISTEEDDKAKCVFNIHFDLKKDQTKRVKFAYIDLLAEQQKVNDGHENVTIHTNTNMWAQQHNIQALHKFAHTCCLCHLLL